MALIELKHLTKTFKGKAQTVEALKDINLAINKGEIYGIIGSCKSRKLTVYGGECRDGNDLNGARLWLIGDL